MRLRDGGDHVRWFRFLALPTKENDGSIVWPGVIRDITRRKMTEDQEELFRSVIVRAADAILIVENDDPEGRTGKIIYANPAFEGLSGEVRRRVRRAAGRDAEKLPAVARSECPNSGDRRPR